MPKLHEGKVIGIAVMTFFVFHMCVQEDGVGVATLEGMDDPGVVVECQLVSF